MLRTVEQSTMRKVYLRILPFAVLTYFFCYLDRINVGFAALTMNKDIGLDAAWYGMASGAFFWGYVLFEVPSNFILEKVGRPPMDRADHDHLGDHLGLHRLRGWPVQFHGDTVPARSCRGRSLPRFCIVLHLLVPRQASRAHQLRFHASAADCGGERHADFYCAFG